MVGRMRWRVATTYFTSPLRSAVTHLGDSDALIVPARDETLRVPRRGEGRRQARGDDVGRGATRPPHSADRIE